MENKIILQKISVKEREPDFDKRVILSIIYSKYYMNCHRTVNDLKTIVIGYKRSITGSGTNYEIKGLPEGASLTKVTHWAELPE